MRRLFPFIAVFLWAGAVYAQSLDVPRGAVVASIGFVGIGDLSLGVTVKQAYSVARAYRSSWASGNGKLIKLRLIASAKTCDILTATTGLPGLTANCSSSPDNGTTLAAWQTNSTFTGTLTGINSTSGTLGTTGDPCTAAAGDVIDGAGFHNKSVTVTSVTSCTGGVGSYAVTYNLYGGSSLSQTAEAMTDYFAAAVVTAYDMSGANQCSAAACDATQATTAKQPVFLIAGCATITGGGPCAQSAFASAQVLASPTITSVADPVSALAVAESTTRPDFLTVIGSTTGGTFAMVYNGSGSAQTTTNDNGPGVVHTGVTNLVAHQLVAISNGAASVAGADNSITTGTIAGGSGTAGTMAIEGTNNAGDGQFEEGQVFSGAIGTTPQTTACNNARLYYGLGGTC